MAELSESHRQIVDQSVNFEDFAFHLYLIKRGLGTILYLYNMQCSNAGHLRIMVFIFLMNWTECSNLLLLAGSWELCGCNSSMFSNCLWKNALHTWYLHTVAVPNKLHSVEEIILSWNLIVCSRLNRFYFKLICCCSPYFTALLE